MTKEQEIQMLRSFAQSVPPDSYLSTFFAYVVPQFENDTRSDFPCLPKLADLETDYRTAQHALTRAHAQIKQAEARLAQLRQEVRTLELRLDHSKAESHRLVNSLQTLQSTLACV